MFHQIKIWTLTTLLSFLFGFQSFSQSKQISPTDSSKWKLVFGDEFSRNKLDKTKWRPSKGVIRDYDFQLQKYWLTEDNIILEDGIMKMIIKKEDYTGTFTTDWSTDPFTKKTADFEYTAAEVYSKERFGYGKYEIRCKIPKGKGMWPAFWLYGEPEIEKINNEIDVFEFWNPKTQLRKYAPRLLSRKHHMTLHYNGKMSHDSYKGPDYSLDFHVFMMIYTPEYIEWYVDGELKRRYELAEKEPKGIFSSLKRKKQGTVFPNIEMNIITGTGVSSLTKAPDEDTVFPQAFEVDYIRYFEIVE